MTHLNLHRPAANDAATPSLSLAENLARVRRRSLALAAPLSAEDQQVQSMPDVSPTKWHLAHTSWFFETFILAPMAPGYRRFDPAFAYLFNSYYNAAGPRHPRPQRGLLTRPSLSEVHAYRRHVDDAMAALLAAPPAAAKARIEELTGLGLQHEQQHQELILMDIKHVLSCNPLLPAYRAGAAASAKVTALTWIECAGGLVEIGAEGDGFAFDNEGPRHKVWLEPFAIASRLVSNGEYLAFIEDGGYSEPAHWLADGWDTVQQQAWQAPLYWRRGEDGGWSEFTLAGARKLDPAAAVCHVSFYEASAYAKWAGKRLPSEAEWEIAARANSHAMAQLFDTCWQWTASPYVAYPGFREPEGAVGEYNGKFMANQMVLRGGASITPEGHARVSYRNFFPPAARWMYGGLRLAADAAPAGGR